jgi:V/A-type H+-transporting ATPase subunit B
MKKVYSKIESINGSVITVKADGVKYGELAEIETSFGTSLAEVNKLSGDLVSLQVFAGGRGVSTGDSIRFLGNEMRVSFSENLLGRIFNGSGESRDSGPRSRTTSSPSGDPR